MKCGTIGSTVLAFCATRCMLLQCGSERCSLVTVALLGRFLPRLGPLPQGERPFFLSDMPHAAASRKTNNAFSCAFFGSNFFLERNVCRQRFAFSTSGPCVVVVRLAERSGSTLIPPRRPDTGAILRAEFPRDDRRASRTRPRAFQTWPRAGSGVHPCTAPG